MRFCIHILLLLVGAQAMAQPYGNEWIDYSQNYFKFDVLDSGIYHLNFNEVNSAVMAAGGTMPTPDQFQIFGKGKELFIYVEDGGDGSFDIGDYIEFHAMANDGSFDTEMYLEPEFQPNPFVSLYNDTASYYFSWSASSNNNRMTEITSTDFSGFLAEDYFYKDVIDINGLTSYRVGVMDGNGKSDAEYIEGEGWYRNAIQGFSIAYPMFEFNVKNIFNSSGINAYLDLAIAGANNPDGSSDHHVMVIRYGNPVQVNGDTVLNTLFNGYDMIHVQDTFDASVYTNSKMEILVGNGGQNSSIGLTVLAQVYLKYPHQFGSFLDEELDNYYFYIGDNIDTTYVKFANFSSASYPYLYDLTNNYRITVQENATIKEAKIPPGTKRKLLLPNASTQIRTVTSLKSVNGVDGKFTNYLSGAIDSCFLIVSHKSLASSAELYKAQRQSTGHNPVLAYARQLEDQFGYGIGKHPQSIRGFAEFMQDSAKAKYLFLFGKGVEPRHLKHSALHNSRALVPTYGMPSSDILLTAHMNGTNFAPALATGRLVASDNTEAMLYYNKILEYDQNTPNIPIDQDQTPAKKEWMKHIMHIGGGNGSAEQLTFVNYLKTFEDTIEDVKYGGDVYTFLRESGGVIQSEVPDEVNKRINNGISLMTFFGHSGGGSFDIALDNVESFTNSNGRYPLFIANSCFAGDIHASPVNQSSQSISEDFVISSKGAIAFLSTVGLGYGPQLFTYTKSFYSHLNNPHYRRPLGELLQYTIADIGSTTNSNLKSTVLEMTLHGDPSIVLNSHVKPDYHVSAERVFFTPEFVSTEVDSFEINIIINNLGKATKDSFGLEITRYLPGGTQVNELFLVPPVYYKDTFVFKMPIDLLNGLGTNEFEIRLDPSNLIDEITTVNNDIIFPRKELFIISNDLIPIWPYNYAIVPEKAFTLKASTANTFASNRQYLMQIDTSDLYNSSFKMETIISSIGGVVEWTIDSSYLNAFNKPDSTCLFWRCTPIDSDTSWKEHTFQYIKGKTGWSQDSYYQFKNDEFNLIDYDRPNTAFEFTERKCALTCQIVGSASTYEEFYDYEYRLNGILQSAGVCLGTPAIYMAVFDSATCEPWIPNNYPQFPTSGLCNGSDEIFSFQTSNPAALENMINLFDGVPDNNYVMFYSVRTGGFENLWTDSIKNVMLANGADSIFALKDSTPYIFFTKKGFPDSTVEVIGSTFTAKINLSEILYGKANSGHITTPIIGPANDWNELHWWQSSRDAFPDSVVLKLYGLETPTSAPELIQEFASSNKHVLNLDSLIPSATYPFLKMKLSIYDDSLETSAQLNKWQIYFEGKPEVALNNSKKYHFYADTIQEGEDLKFLIAVDNVSRWDMDSLNIYYWIEDVYNNKTLVEYKRHRPLAAGETLLDTLTYYTKGLGGHNNFWIELNPEDSLWQFEQYHFNNIGRQAFYVIQDRINPLLDVTFDGIHILDRDIVSPNPTVVIRVKDEGIMGMCDTANYTILLTNPANEVTKIPIENNNEVEVICVDEPGKLSTTIEFNPKLQQDGIWSLSVQARDGSSNAAGDNDYSISFEVINKSTITHVMNYPNPFSTSTQFVFTLTGAIVPDFFRIQILSVSGKVVREITRDELGDLHIGRNITNYRWDGTDEYGDALSNGIYFYRVITQIADEEVEHRSSAADSFFKKDFGKMYLMR